VACRERSARNLGDPVRSGPWVSAQILKGHWEAKRPNPPWGGKRTDRKEGTLRTCRETDQPVVLRDGKADHMGKGLA
jgi:hypothetical protein